MARDVIHNAVKNALIREGWTITHDPFRIEYEEFTLSADLAAENPFAAEKTARKSLLKSNPSLVVLLLKSYNKLWDNM